MKNLLLILIITISVFGIEKKAQSYGMKNIPTSFLIRKQKNNPSRRIKISEFWVDSKPITQKEYLRLMGKDPSRVKNDAAPVESVRWWDAIKYCNARSLEAGLEPLYNELTGECNFSGKGFRLPTEAEWELAFGVREKINIVIGRMTEWCTEISKKKYYYKCPLDDPEGPPIKKKKKYYSRVVRGGSRGKSLLDIDCVDVGFRCVLRK